ncbi:MAG: DUF1592 domain-containing protein [Rhodospirillaceae bacterium]
MKQMRLIAVAVCALLTACAPADDKVSGAEATAGAAPVVPMVAPGEATMRRLTAEQYQNVIADLFGDTIELGGRFEPELRVNGLMAVGASSVSVTAAGMEQYDMMARRIAAQIMDDKRRALMMPCRPVDAKLADDACARQFLSESGLWLYRRPLTDAELNSYVTTANRAAGRLGSFYDGLAMSFSAMLASPRFLFRQETVEPDPAHKGQFRLTAYAKAAQLSFFLWNAGPDRALFEAARTGEIHTPKGYAKQVDRMIASPRLERGVRAFFVDNFHFDEFSLLTKDAEIFPKFSAQVLGDAQEQTLRTVVDLLVKQRGDYRDIFTTKKTFLTQELAAIYKVPVAEHGPNGSPDIWQAYEFPKDSAYGGVQSQIAFTALHAHPGRSSPTIRGKAIREILMCQKVPAPPGNVDFKLVQDTNNPVYRTVRQRMDAHATNPVCTGCHKITDPMGYALETFDGGGAFRTKENGAEIDASGTLDGKQFKSAMELGKVLHDSPATANCLVNRMASYATGRTFKREPWIAAMEQGFAAKGYVVPELMRAIALHDVFTRVAPPAQQAAN